MKSLVTGGAGFIGSHIVDTLLDAGHEVIVLDNEYSDNEKFNWNDKVENHVVDICDYESSRKYYDGVDYVFHAAAEARIGPAIANPINAVNINCIGTCTVLQCAREAGVKKVMYSSTSSAYGLNDPPNTEDQPEDCLNPYSVSKIAGEKICKMYTDLFDLPTVIFRYFNVFGERAPTKGQYAPVIGIFMRQRAAGEQLTIVGDGEQRRDFTHIDDIVEALYKIGIGNYKHNDAWELGTGNNYSINEVYQMFKNKFNVECNHVLDQPGNYRETLRENDDALEQLDWKPQDRLLDYIQNL